MRIHSSSGAHHWRIALYSHDTMGLGHKRRNLLIAQTLGCSLARSNILMISGIQNAGDVSVSSNVDCLTLPSIYKNIDGEYQARRLNLSLSEIIKLRSQTILTTMKTFEPDLFIVDNVPRGAVRELDLTLDYLKKQGKTRCILGLRDILDAPEAVRRDWKNTASEEAIQTYYDSVWVYGDPAVYDLAQEYRFHPNTATKLRYTGYLDQRDRLRFVDMNSIRTLKSLRSSPKRLVLCVVGGGQDGAHLAETFAQTKLPSGMAGVILTGPFMPQKVRQRLHHYAANCTDLHVLEYVAEPTFLLKQADCVISMGGYNTTCELLSFQKRSLIVPRIQPRQEQLIRAKRLQALGLIDMLHPQDLTPQALTHWLMQDSEPPQMRDRIDLNGLTRIPQFVAETLSGAASRSASS
jgi:predicted glycosyltransferase